jgi:gliding motility-associated-like protein
VGGSTIVQQNLRDQQISENTHIVESAHNEAIDFNVPANNIDHTNVSDLEKNEDSQSNLEVAKKQNANVEIVTEEINVESFEEAVEQIEVVEIPQEQISITEVAEANFESSIQSNKVGGESPLEVAFKAPENVTRAVWDAGDGSPKIEGLTYEHTFEQPGTYTVTMIAQRDNGEFYQDQMMVSVAAEDSENQDIVTEEKLNIEVPNVFTPNSDGYNDEYLISVDNAAELQLSVFNSAGRVVYQKRSQQIAWDGKELDGSDAPTGTYFYQLKVVMSDGGVEIKKGSLTLTR